LGSGVECHIDLVVGARPQDMELHADGARSLLQVVQLPRSRRIGRIHQDAERVRLRQELVQEPKPLGFKRRADDAHPSSIAARPVVARHQPELDRIAPDGKNDRNVRSRGLGRQRRRFSADRHQHGHWTLNEFLRPRRKSVVLAMRPTVFDHHVPALGIAGLGQPTPERGHQMSTFLGRSAAEKPHNRHRGLLRARRKRPRRRAAEERHEIASPHTNSLPG
jgi:hypothetical protein